MKKFKVDVCRTGYGFRTIEVEAKDNWEAMNKAIDEAGNYEFSEKSADYDIDGITEIKEGSNNDNSQKNKKDSNKRARPD